VLGEEIIPFEEGYEDGNDDAAGRHYVQKLSLDRGREDCARRRSSRPRNTLSLWGGGGFLLSIMKERCKGALCSYFEEFNFCHHKKYVFILSSWGGGVVNLVKPGKLPGGSRESLSQEKVWPRSEKNSSLLLPWASPGAERPVRLWGDRRAISRRWRKKGTWAPFDSKGSLRINHGEGSRVLAHYRAGKSFIVTNLEGGKKLGAALLPRPVCETISRRADDRTSFRGSPLPSPVCRKKEKLMPKGGRTWRAFSSTLCG